MGDPVVLAIVGGAVAVILATIVVRIVQGRLEARRRRREIRERRRRLEWLEQRRQELERLAARIVATSSTAAVPGFVIVRQVEAVFTEGQATPAEAVVVLKALAAQRGANAIINLSSQRLPSGKCTAQGDAVIVRALESSSLDTAAQAPPSEPSNPPSSPAGDRAD